MTIELKNIQELIEYLERCNEFKDPVNFSFVCSTPGCQIRDVRKFTSVNLKLIKSIYEYGDIDKLKYKCLSCMREGYRELHPENF